MSLGRRGVKLEVLETGRVPMPYGYVFRRDGNRLTRLRAGLSKHGETLPAPCLAFVVRHPEAGNLLIDTGLHPDAARNLRKDFGFLMSRLFGELEPSAVAFAEQLRSVSVEPEKVIRVVMTHLHVDRTSAARGYVAHHLPPASKMQLLDYEKDGEPHDAFARTIDLFGDDTVRLIYTPGHTHGHQSLLLRLEDGRTVLLVGDAAYTLRSIREQLLPMATADDASSLRTLGELNAFARDHPDALLVPTHDPEAWKALSRTATGRRS